MLINSVAGGGGGAEILLAVSVASGSVVTAVKGGKSVTGVSVDGVCVLVVPEAGTWTVSATLGGKTTPAQTVAVKSQWEAALEYPLYAEELSVGDSVWMDPASASGSKIEFLVVNQGKPSSEYDDSCDGTWLMAKTWFNTSRFGSRTYLYSTLRETMTSTALSRLNSVAQEIIRGVTIPTTDGAVGSDKLFAPSASELGMAESWIPVEGAKLAYFDSGVGESTKRALGAVWWTRTKRTDDYNYVFSVNEIGEPTSNSPNSNEYTRPFCVIPSKTILDADHNLVSVGE